MPLTAQARAEAVFVDGSTRLTTLRSQVPLSLRQTDGGLTVVASAFGPLGGDRTDLTVDVGPGASLHVGSAGAQVAQPGPRDPVSRAAVHLHAGAGAHLSWRPQPLVVTAGAEHRLDLDVELAAGSSLLLAETVVLREGGRYRARWRVRHDGRALFSTDLDVGAGAPAGWDGPAVLGGARVLLTVLQVGGELPVERDVPGGALMRLAGPGVVLSWLGSDVVCAERVCEQLIAGTRAGTSAATSR